MMPSWQTYLQVLVLLAIVGFALIILSGFWHVILVLVIAALVAWLWCHWPRK